MFCQLLKNRFLGICDGTVARLPNERGAGAVEHKRTHFVNGGFPAGKLAKAMAAKQARKAQRCDSYLQI